MYRIRDFIFKEVVSLNGKKLGFIGDILIDFDQKIVSGFDVISNNILRKDLNVDVRDTLSFEPVLITSSFFRGERVKFNDIRAFDVVDRGGRIMGHLEDVVFYEKSFKIRAFILSRGFIYDIFRKRKLLPAQKLVLGEKSILYI